MGLQLRLTNLKERDQMDGISGWFHWNEFDSRAVNRRKFRHSGHECGVDLFSGFGNKKTMECGLCFRSGLTLSFCAKVEFPLVWLVLKMVTRCFDDFDISLQDIYIVRAQTNFNNRIFKDTSFSTLFLRIKTLFTYNITNMKCSFFVNGKLRATTENCSICLGLTIYNNKVV